MKTARGVYKNIEESTYYYNLGGLTFYFSSLNYRQKFENKVLFFIKEEQKKFEEKYEIPILMEMYFAIAFYKKIEQRGFRIEFEEGKKINKNRLLFYMCLDGRD